MASDVRTNVLVLLSGGIDSAACLDFYLSQGHSVEALHFSYGQLAASNERKAAEGIAVFYGAQLRIVEFSRLAETAAIGYVRGRNALFVHAALFWCPFAAGLIATGIHAGTRYVDCSPRFTSVMQDSLNLYCDGAIQIAAPFVEWNKQQIVDYCRTRGVPLATTYSCEAGTPAPCGRCLSCEDRKTLNAD
jgi:7-cyano-7-deazaguanine synthase